MIQSPLLPFVASMSLLLGGVFFVGGSGVARGSTSRTVDPCEPVKIGILSGMDQLDSRDAARCREHRREVTAQPVILCRSLLLVYRDGF